MNRHVLVPLVVATLILGLATPAFAARKVSDWKKVAGHSTSCALVRASINSENRKAGGETANFRGCSAANDTRSVPPGYIAVYARIISSADHGCGELSPVSVYNQTTTYRVVATMPLQTPATSNCPESGYYYGAAIGRRYLESTGEYVVTGSYSTGTVAFLSIP